jgi:hypothetical protein
MVKDNKTLSRSSKENTINKKKEAEIECQKLTGR